jgi:hypothetical protein
LYSNDPSISEVSRKKWFVQRIYDYDCNKRNVTLSGIPSSLFKINQNYFNDDQLSILVLSPLMTSMVSSSIQLKGYQDRGEIPVSSQSPLTVLQHPLSRSHIARTSLARLEQDIVDYANDESHSLQPVMDISKSLRDLPSAKTNLLTAIDRLKLIMQSLVTLRENDNKVLKQGIADILKFCNSNFSSNVNDFHSLKHVIMRYSRSEAEMVIFTNKCLFLFI